MDLSSFITDTDLAPLRDPTRRFLNGSVANSDAAGLWRTVVEQGWIEALDAGDAGPARTLLMLNAELGRKGLALPLADSFWVLVAARGTDDTAFKALAERVRAGQAVSLAIPGSGSALRDESLAFQEGKLDATLCNVEHLPLAAHIMIAEGNRALWLESANAELIRNPGYAAPAWHDVHLKAAPCQVASGVEAASWAGDMLRLSLAARAWGAAERALELIVDYAKLREQFGQPIGKFQAVQHKLASARIALDASRLLINRAGAAFDANDRDWTWHAGCAAAFAAPALRSLVLECHHVFGAIGYMEEHDMPALFRRVHADVSRLGGPPVAARAVAARLLEANAEDALFEPLNANAEAANFRRELRAWLAEHWSAERREAPQRETTSERGHDREFQRAVGRQGWIGMALPAEVGGQDRSVWEQSVFDEEMNLAEAPTYGFGATRLLAPAVAQYGTPEQRHKFLPLMLSGETVFCLGYSEPNAGSDLASLKTRAVRDGDHWVINGSKIWTTLGTVADYVWLAARTDLDAPKHKGISVFIVPIDTPGITVRPLQAMNGQRPCAVFYDDVRVPADAIVGAVNQGWQVITSALAHERVMMGGGAARMVPFFRRLVRAAREMSRDGRPLAEDPVVRAQLGTLAAELQAARLLALRPTALMAAGGHAIVEAAIAKTFFGELYERLSEAALDILGCDALLACEAPGSVVDGAVGSHLAMAMMYVIGGGANEIQRNIIAQAGLGLPR